jgi:hypothetical protein
MYVDSASTISAACDRCIANRNPSVASASLKAPSRYISPTRGTNATHAPACVCSHCGTLAASWSGFHLYVGVLQKNTARYCAVPVGPSWRGLRAIGSLRFLAAVREVTHVETEPVKPDSPDGPISPNLKQADDPVSVASDADASVGEGWEEALGWSAEADDDADGLAAAHGKVPTPSGPTVHDFAQSACRVHTCVCCVRV